MQLPHARPSNANAKESAAPQRDGEGSACAGRHTHGCWDTATPATGNARSLSEAESEHVEPGVPVEPHEHRLPVVDVYKHLGL